MNHLKWQWSYGLILTLLLANTSLAETNLRNKNWSVIPTFLLVYKYAPEKISEDSLRSNLRRLITQDQRYYKNLQDAQDQGQNATGFVDRTALFDKEQVVGRSPDFAVNELLGEYKKMLKRWADSVPDTVYIEDYVKTTYFRYQDGKLGSGTASGQGADVFNRYSVVPDYTKIKVPELGARELAMGSHALLGSIDSSIESKVPKHRSVRFAYDKKPIFHAIPLPSKEAEAMFIEPDRSSCGSPISPPLERMRLREARAAGAEALQKYEQEQQAKKECQKTTNTQLQRFQSGFKILVELETEGFVGNTDILSLKIKGAQVYSPHGRLFKTYASSELAPATDAREEQLVAENQARQTEKIQELGLEQQRSNMENKLGSSDVNGLKLTMSFPEAEGLVKQKMQVARVRESASNPKNPNKKVVFADYLQFENEDGSERIMLYKANRDSEKLVGIGRLLIFPEGVPAAQIKEQLYEKYGQPTEEKPGGEMVWHAHKDRKTCRAHVELTRPPKLIVGEGPMVEQYTSIAINYPTNRLSADMYHNTLGSLMASCSPQVTARYLNSRFYVVVSDFSVFAAENIEQKAAPKKVDLNL